MASQYSFNDPDRPKWGAERPASDPFADARLGREIEDSQRSSGPGREVLGAPTNFLPPHLRTVTTETPAMRQAARQAILAAHPDRAALIRQRAALPQAIAREVTVSGTNTRSTGRFDTEGFVRQVRRDPHSGRIVISWERVDEYGEGG